MTRFGALGALSCALFLLLALAACDDPTDVGGELIDREDLGPQRAVLEVAVDTVQYAPVTGAASPASVGVGRFLAGQTTGDPLGDVEATGYVDFGGGDVPSDAEDRSLEAVELRMEPGYFYGDTTQASTFALYDLEEEWEATGARADTSLGGIVEPAPVTTFRVQPGDTLVTVALPENWIGEHAGALRAASDSAFAADFHGFQVRPTSASHVAGFASSETSLRATFEAPGDEDEASNVTYPVVRHLTTIRRPRPKGVEDRYVLQDGTGRALAFSFDFPDSLRNAAVNNATLLFEADSTLEAAPPGFARPTLETLDLYSVPLSGGLPTGEEPRLLQARFTLNADSARFENNFSLDDIVQDILLGASDLGRFQLRPPLRRVQSGFNQTVPVPVTSLSSALVRRGAGQEPRLVLTYTPTDE